MERDVFYQDQDGRICQTLETAALEEDGREVVIYQEMYGDFEKKADFADHFLARMRPASRPFRQREAEQVPAGMEAAAGMRAKRGTQEDLDADPGETRGQAGDSEGTALLMAFLEAPDSEKKLEILYQMKDCVTDYLVDAMAISLDLDIPQGIVEERYQMLIRSLKTRLRYESRRLR